MYKRNKKYIISTWYQSYSSDLKERKNRIFPWRKKNSSSISDADPKAATGNTTSHNETILITCYKLNGQSYTHWFRSVRLFLQGNGKEDYMTSNTKQPTKTDSNHAKWKLENSLVMSWLLNSMTNEYGENFMYYSNVAEIWNAAKETYLNMDNTSAIFEIKSLLHNLQQGDPLVTEYYHTLTKYWQ